MARPDSHFPGSVEKVHRMTKTDNPVRQVLHCLLFVILGLFPRLGGRLIAGPDISLYATHLIFF